MPRPPPPGFYVLTVISLFVLFIFWAQTKERPAGHVDRTNLVGTKPQLIRPHFGGGKPTTATIPTASVSPSSSSSDSEIHNGDVTAAKLENETLKEELGRAAWKLFHTTMARFPDKPTADESQALKDYIRLFARLYPCGDCAKHFQQIIKKYPPQTSSRSSAAAWACFVHNEVNISKGKPVFDCANIGDWYDCGCADDERESMAEAGKNSEAVAKGG